MGHGQFLETVPLSGALVARDRALLLPKPFNQAYGDLPYDEKAPHYDSHNLLARSLLANAYDRNPGFRRFLKESGLRFRPHTVFRKADVDARQQLYQALAECIWDPARLGVSTRFVSGSEKSDS